MIVLRSCVLLAAIGTWLPAHALGIKHVERASIAFPASFVLSDEHRALIGGMVDRSMSACAGEPADLSATIEKIVDQHLAGTGIPVTEPVKVYLRGRGIPSSRISVREVTVGELRSGRAPDQASLAIVADSLGIEIVCTPK